MINHKKVGERLGQVRIAMGLSKIEMAQKLDFGYTRYHNWEKRGTPIPRDPVEHICQTLGIERDWLLYGDLVKMPAILKNSPAAVSGRLRPTRGKNRGGASAMGRPRNGRLYKVSNGER